MENIYNFLKIVATLSFGLGSIILFVFGIYQVIKYVINVFILKKERNKIRDKIINKLNKIYEFELTDRHIINMYEELKDINKLNKHMIKNIFKIYFKSDLLYIETLIKEWSKLNINKDVSDIRKNIEEALRLFDKKEQHERIFDSLDLFTLSGIFKKVSIYDSLILNQKKANSSGALGVNTYMTLLSRIYMCLSNISNSFIKDKTYKDKQNSLVSINNKIGNYISIFNFGYFLHYCEENYDEHIFENYKFIEMSEDTEEYYKTHHLTQLRENQEELAFLLSEHIDKYINVDKKEEKIEKWKLKN